VQILCVNPQCTPISLVDTVIYPFDPPVCPPFTLDFDFTRVWPVLLLSGTPPHPQFSQLFFFLVNCIPIFSVSGLSFLQISLFSHSTLASSTPLPSKWVISQNFSGAFLVFFGFLIGKFSNVIHVFGFEGKNYGFSRRFHEKSPVLDSVRPPFYFRDFSPKFLVFSSLCDIHRCHKTNRFAFKII
jgi:hypothetical protein